MVNLRFYELITLGLQQIPVWYAPDTYETIVVIGEFAVVNCILFFAIANMVACSHVMTAIAMETKPTGLSSLVSLHYNRDKINPPYPSSPLEPAGQQQQQAQQQPNIAPTAAATVVPATNDNIIVRNGQEFCRSCEQKIKPKDAPPSHTAVFDNNTTVQGTKRWKQMQLNREQFRSERFILSAPSYVMSLQVNVLLHANYFFAVNY